MSAVMRRILDRAQPGTHGGVARHVERGEVMRQMIEAHFSIARPEQWRAKHVRWVIERGLADRSPATRYDYYRTARVIAAALGHWPAWEPYLRGPWTRPSGAGGPPADPSAGGRPVKLAHRVRVARPVRTGGG